MSVLSVAANALAVNAWTTVATSNFVAAVYAIDSYDRSISQYAAKGWWDTRGYLWMGGHPHPPESWPSRIIRYVEATNTWEVVWTYGGIGDSAHQYCEWEWRQSDVGIWGAEGSVAQARVNTGAGWVNRGSTLGRSYSDAPYRAMTWFPEMARFVWYFERTLVDNLYTFNPATDTWASLGWSRAAQCSHNEYHPIAHYCPQHQVVVFGAGNGCQHLWKINAAGVVTPCDSAPANCGVTGAATVADPVTGMLLFLFADRTFRAFDPRTGTWGASLNNATYNLDGGGGTSLVGVPIATYGVVAYLDARSTSTGTVYLYRYADSRSSLIDAGDAAYPLDDDFNPSRRIAPCDVGCYQT